MDGGRRDRKYLVPHGNLDLVIGEVIELDPDNDVRLQ